MVVVGMEKAGHLLVIVVFLASGGETGSNLHLRLQVVKYTSNATDACIGGDVGLTNTSVLVQFRATSQQRTSESEWRFLAVIDLKLGLNESLELPDMQRVQFRLLQLEHGGGSCNCWMLEEAVVEWQNRTGQNSAHNDIFAHGYCFSTSSTMLFC